MGEATQSPSRRLSRITAHLGAPVLPEPTASPKAGPLSLCPGLGGYGECDVSLGRE